jgi:hypothetical protein
MTQASGTRTNAHVAVSALLALVLALSHFRDARAQDEPLRIGLGLDAVLQSSEGLGIGFRTRISRPINWDVSIAFDFGLTGFLLGGTDEATYVFDPQVSVIVTFPDLNRATYLLGGFGVYAPFGSGSHADGGPMLHVGIGRAVPLRESTFYYEVDPAFIIRESSLGVSIPFRVGVII